MNPGGMLAHYRVLGRLGAGGMGVVYKALDTHLNRTVAIKVLPADAVAHPGRRERFIQEARAASALDHPNIVTVHDIAEEKRLTSDPAADFSPAWSPDGRHIAFYRLSTTIPAASGDGGGEVVVVPTLGGPERKLARTAVSFLGGPRAPVGLAGLAWLPDGKSLVVMDRSSPQELPSVSPNGRMLAFCRTRGYLNTDVYVLSLGSEVRPSWSRDGKSTYFSSNRTGTWQVWKAPAGGGPAVQVTRQGGREAFEAHDRRFVYYAGTGTRGVWRVPGEGGEETRVVERGGGGRWALGRDGIYLIDASDSAGPRIEYFHFATERITTLARLPSGTLISGGSPLDVSPDGRTILYTQLDQTESDILMLDNFR